MTYMDSDSDTSSYSRDVFDNNDDIEGYKDLMSRNGILSTQLPSIITWIHDAFTDRRSNYIGQLKKNNLKPDTPFILNYNTTNTIIVMKAKTELDCSLKLIRDDTKERGGNSTISPFTTFTDIFPEDYFVLF